MKEELQWSQVSCVGEPHPKTWDDYERGCLLTFGGGYNSANESGAFRHGMQTVFNLLRSEFPPAEQCKSAAAAYSEGHLAGVTAANENNLRAMELVEKALR